MELTKPDRACRIIIEQPFEGVASITTVDEQVIRLDDGSIVHSLKGNMISNFDPENPLDAAVYEAVKAKVLSMRAKRDTPPGDSH